MKYLLTMTIFVCLLAFILMPTSSNITEPKTPPKTSLTKVNTIVDSYQGVKVYYNGNMRNTHGRNLTKDGYNLGLKWQCVEFVKRFYFEYFNHKMPDSYGHAKDFFDQKIGNGYNSSRALNQYLNGNSNRPKRNMIIVFDANEDNPYGHIAIISKVIKDEIEVVQQNWGKHTRMTLPLFETDGKYIVGHADVLGWLGK